MTSTKKPLHSGHWSTKANMDQPRSHTPCATVNGKIYLFGGGSYDFASLNSSMAYNPADDSWENCADMPSLRSGAVPETLGNKVYVMGGGFKQADGTFKFLTAVEIFDTDANSWEKGPDLLQPHDYPAVAQLDGDLYVLAGHHPNANLAGPKTDPGFEFCEKLTPGNDHWEEIAAIPTPRFALAAITQNDEILTMGGVAFTPEGFNNFDFLETYNPATNQWRREERFELPWTAAGLSACLLEDHLFIFGGYSGDGICDHAACYSFADKKWEHLPPMPGPRCATGIAIVDRTIYLFGGWADDGRTPTDTVMAYSLP